MTRGRYDEDALDRFADEVRRESFCVLPSQFDTSVLRRWADAFVPLLEENVRTSAEDPNRGAQRFYVTLPLRDVFFEPDIIFDPDVLAICERLVGPRMVLCQFATDTPLQGSDTQAVHRDSPGLFGEPYLPTPPYQLAVNFPLVDVTPENGPTEIARRTHVLPKDEGLARIERGEAPLEPVLMRVGDVVIRDVRHLHRGTPNTTAEPRPMVVLGYSRAWLRRPEVSIRVPQSSWARLTPAQRDLLRFEPVVPDDAAPVEGEVYKAFAY